MPERRQWLKGIMVGMAVGLSGVLLALTPFHQPLETRVGLHSLFHMRGAVSPPPNVAIIAIGRRTGEKLGIPDLPRDWPRSIHAKLIEKLVEGGASAIVFDMDFRKSRNKQHEKIFADAMSKSGRVILFEHLDGRRQHVEDANGNIKGTVWIEELTRPLPILTKSARAIGSFTLPKTASSVDQFWLFKASLGDKPTIPAVTAQIAALGYYETWRELLLDTTKTKLDWLPANQDDIKSPAQLVRLMQSTENLFQRNPELAESIRTRLTNMQLNDRASRVLTGLVNLYGGTNERFLNFYGPAGTIPTVPYQAVIKGESKNLPDSALDFKDKAVFIGYADKLDPGIMDHFYTIYTRDDGVDLSGVEIAATGFANILADQSVKPVSMLNSVVIIFLFGLTIGLLAYLVPAIPATILSVGLAVGYAVFVQMCFNHNGLWLPVVTPVLIQLPLALFAGTIIQYRSQQHRIQHISEAIRYYVPESVSQELTASEVNPSNVNKVTYGTCLATDMAGFSTIAEKMKPGDLASFLNEYFEVLAKALKQHQVEVTEFRADAIMCAWTGDADDDSVRIRPVLAALEAAREMNVFNIQRDIAGSLRVGMADGEFYVGHAGGGGHYVYSIVGDCANTAARIEGLNKQVGTSILATRTVLEGQTDLLTRNIGSFVFVGKTEALPIVEVVAARSNSTATQLELCERFDFAHQAFALGEWASAVERFEKLLIDFPQDMPTRYLLTRCKAQLNGDIAGDGPGIITLTSK